MDSSKGKPETSFTAKEIFYEYTQREIKDLKNTFLYVRNYKYWILITEKRDIIKIAQKFYYTFS